VKQHFSRVKRGGVGLKTHEQPVDHRRKYSISLIPPYTHALPLQPKLTATPVTAPVPTLQRAIELRPPGRGEASAFDRAQELVDRLNAQSAAIQYRLNGNRLEHEVKDEAALTFFDRRIRDFIDRAQVVPLRVITSAGRVNNGAGGFDPLLQDSFVAGYVDLDDLLNTDNQSFQDIFIHFMSERFAVRDYDRLIGTDALGNQFNRAHAVGIDAERDRLRDVLNDPSIIHNYDEVKPGGNTLVRAFRSRDHGYRLFIVLSNAAGERTASRMFVQTADGRRLSVEDFQRECRAAAP